MQLKKILLRELRAYIDSDEYKTSTYIPISRHRALSHIQNPRAKPDDLVLVLVYEAGAMVGYLGVLADDLHFDTGVAHVGWLSCMWVNPIMRGKGVAMQLLQTVFEAWNYQILVTEFTPAAYGLYQKTGQFIDLAKPKGVRGYLRLNLHYLLPNKNPKWNKWKPLLKLVDGSFNVWKDWRNKRTLKSITAACPRFEYVPKVDEESWQLIKQCSPTLVNRQKEDLEWIADNPWLLSGGLLADANAKRYHFSSVASFFSFLHIKVYNDQQELVAFVLLSIRNQHLKVPYAYFKPEAAGAVMQVVYQHLLTHQLDMLTLFQPDLVASVSKEKNPFFKIRELQRHYIIGKVLAEPLHAMSKITIQDGDADAVFT